MADRVEFYARILRIRSSLIYFSTSLDDNYDDINKFENFWEINPHGGRNYYGKGIPIIKCQYEEGTAKYKQLVEGKTVKVIGVLSRQVGDGKKFRNLVLENIEVLQKEQLKQSAKGEITICRKDKNQYNGRFTYNRGYYENILIESDIELQENKTYPCLEGKKLVTTFDYSGGIYYQNIVLEDIIIPSSVKPIPKPQEKKDTIDEKADEETNKMVHEFHNYLQVTGLTYDEKFIKRFIASLLAKPFLILTGLSGSDKTRLVIEFAKWITKKNNGEYVVIPVGADWTNRDSLLGYPDGLNHDRYVKDHYGVIDLIFSANKNGNKPYFLILDEMNLSHVERYFSDFLSAMESKKPIQLYDRKEKRNKTPKDDDVLKHEINIPENLFVIGTVNIDETTYMFSPKVLDRANTLEFRVTTKQLEDFLSESKEKNEHPEAAEDIAKEFMSLKNQKPKIDYESLNNFRYKLIEIHKNLSEIGAEFGYRTAKEMIALVYYLKKLGVNDENDAMDIAILQKILPKLHGSRTKIEETLDKLIIICQGFTESKDKLVRMKNTLEQNNYVSFAEA
ncbi:MAG: hypothetical protein OXE55_00205 [Flavobacteriaceae bacterium]|nr:hypothetical protein [Flavobacteriaceae bacterium]